MRRIMVAALAGLGLVTGLLAAPTALASADDRGAAPTAGTARYCVVDLSTRHEACGSGASAALAALGSKTWIPLVTLYDGSGYSTTYGKKTLVLGGPKACTSTTSDVDYANANLADYGWSNVASSFTTQNQCDLKGYDLADYKGAAFVHWQDHDINLTTWNNRISSLRLS